MHEITLFLYCFTTGAVCVEIVGDVAELILIVSILTDWLLFVWFKHAPFAICVKTGCFKTGAFKFWLFRPAGAAVYLIGVFLFGTCWLIKKFWLVFVKTVPGAVDLRANCFGAFAAWFAACCKSPTNFVHLKLLLFYW